MRSRRALFIDTGASHVAGGSFAISATGKLRLERFSFEQFDSDPAQEMRWIEQTAQTTAAISAREGYAGAAELAVPGHLALAKFIKTPAIDRAKRSRTIQFEASQNIPYPLDEVVWDYLTVSDDGKDLEIMLAAAKADAMDALCAAMDSAGLPIVRAIPAALALYWGFRYNYPEITGTALVANVGARSTHLLFIETGRFLVRTFALGGNAATQSMADELKIPFARAEDLKKRVLAGTCDLLPDEPWCTATEHASQNFCARLQMEISRSLMNFERHSSAEQPSVLFLTGGGSQIDALPNLLTSKLNLPVARYDSLRRVELSPDAATTGAKLKAPMLADLVGLATQLAAREQSSINLLPLSLRKTLNFRRRQPVFIAAMAFLAASFLPPIWHYERLATTAQTKANEINRQLIPLRAVERVNADRLQQIEHVTQEIAALERLVETKSSWLAFLGDLQARLGKVEDVWLEKLAVIPASPEEMAAANRRGERREITAETQESKDKGSRQKNRSARSAVSRVATRESHPLRLLLSGRLLDKNNPISKVSSDSYDRANRLLASFADSRFVAAVENERFDNSQSGILRFDFTLPINPQHPL